MSLPRLVGNVVTGYPRARDGECSRSETCDAVWYVGWPSRKRMRVGSAADDLSAWEEARNIYVGPRCGQRSPKDTKIEDVHLRCYLFHKGRMIVNTDL